MKNINKYILGALLAGTATLTFSSCDLDEYNPSGETADEVFVTPEGMEYLVNQMYYNFRWKYYGREDPVLYMEASADIWQNIGNNYEYGKQLTRRVDLQGDRGQIANAWNRVYDNVNVANAVINRIGDVVGLSESTKKDFEGEARFMRSYCYWWLVEFFGDIELRTQETSTPEFTAVRTDRKVIYDEVIIPDARFAAENLPVNPYNGNVGRSTKKAAKALLARVLLTRAQYETAGSAEQRKFYEEALEAALDVVNNKAAYGIKLYNTYDEIWQAKNNKTNTEYLWITSHSSISSLNPQANNPNRLHRYFTPKLVGNAGIRNTATTYEYPSEGGLIMPTYYFLKLWQDWDIRYDVLFQEEFPENASKAYTWEEGEANKYMRPDLIGKEVAVGATVLKFTKESVSDDVKKSVNYAIVDIDDTYETENVNSFGGCKVRNPDGVNSMPNIAAAFPRFMKYRIWDRDPNGTILIAAANGQVGFADVPVMRYAEMPLIAAECYIALGNTSAAAQIINQEIRNARVVKPGHSLAEAQVSANDMNIEWIMEERARELCGENLRWFDVKRVYGPQGKYASTILGRNPSMIGDDCMQEYHTLWPIPNTFLEKLQNAEEFGQNPGYNPYVRSEK
ncbi:MAG: RagB/SusD family nutrient uptake outer membrane protein [Prevotella sp.]|nr:RagB/SusD family nutrient uptake outer membrane protein [Prevotella sp.]